MPARSPGSPGHCAGRVGVGGLGCDVLVRRVPAGQVMTDEQLEVRIEQARDSFAESRTKEEMHERWTALASLIDKRSAEQVRRMEEERGLR